MLKAIEISGFKSFADRTKLEFAEGICAIVGPNGSGKSNIIDAVKWVLGEQSMKKLRSTESTDVIFSGAANRSPMGAAEVTLTFDNVNRHFNLDTPEVSITRRIYRSKESEYLVNQQSTTLKEIKTLLAGTGIGTNAYSIIEQGRVESLLQSPAAQRRGIFDEAAGISRFNARKLEIQRRFERVDHTVIRLHDIVSGLEQQLKAARTQAGKAQLYKEYTERLKELRIQTAFIEYSEKEKQKKISETACDAIKEQSEKYAENVRQQEEHLNDCNAEIEDIDQEIKQQSGELASIRQQITNGESTIVLHFANTDEIESDIDDALRQHTELKTKSTGIEELKIKTEKDIDEAQQNVINCKKHYQTLFTQEKIYTDCLSAAALQCENIVNDIQNCQRRITEETANIRNLETQLKTLESTQAKDSAKSDKLAKQNSDWETQLAQLKDEADMLESAVKLKKGQLDEAKQRKSSRIKEYSELTEKVSALKQRQSGLRERKELLEELVRKNEGLSPGVREVLAQQKNSKSPFRHAFGLVADLLRVEFELSTLIELALSDVSQRVVVEPKKELFQHIEQHAAEFSGRVGFVWLDISEKEAPWMKQFVFAGRKGVIGRADQFVQTESKFQHLAKRLLGRVWIVQNIAVAKQLYKESDDRTSFLTVSGEMITPDGALIVGPLHNASGLITRRSELRNLTEQLTEIDREVMQLEVEIGVAKDRVDSDEIDVEDETREHQKAVTHYDTLRHKYLSLDDKYKQSVETHSTLLTELERHNVQIAETIQLIQTSRETKQTLTDKLSMLDIQQIAAKQSLEDAQRDFEEHQRKTTNTKIDLAKSEERLSALNERMQQYGERLKERQRLFEDNRKQRQALKERKESILLAVLHIQTQLADLYLRKEELAALLAGNTAARNKAAGLRHKLQNELKKSQKQLEVERQKRHTKQLEYERLLQEQRTLTERIKEEYDVDITVKEQDAETSRAYPDIMNGINDLRTKLQKLGNVNLEAMETLDELEAEYQRKNEIYSDVVQAKKQIEKDLELFKGTSEQMFSETFEGVRLHFQELFRQLFGGGNADLTLDNPDNVLESGINIMAKPPGKELTNVMLLSGGEKTLTCFALLLAFFRYKPNPVCILDECDAALDEGNVDRYNNLIRQFSSDTQFIMISHNKKSMVYADRLYGVTMQESGISKAVSVEFKEVGENGEILKRAA